MPRSTAARISEVPCCLSTAGPRPKLSPMQPRPRAETSRLLFPSLRFCIISPDCECGQMHESKHRVPGFEVLACFGELLAESSRYHGRQCCRQLESGKQESGVLAMFLKAFPELPGKQSFFPLCFDDKTEND